MQLRQLQSEYIFLQGQYEDRKRREEALVNSRSGQHDKLREELYQLRDQVQEKDIECHRISRANKKLQANALIQLASLLIDVIHVK